MQLALQKLVDPGGRLRIAALRGRALAVQRRMLRRWFADCTGWRDLSADRTDAILDLAASGRGNRTIEAGGGWTVTMGEGMLRAERNDIDEREAR